MLLSHFQEDLFTWVEQREFTHQNPIYKPFGVPFLEDPSMQDYAATFSP